jgi:hypothetical protein
LQADRSLPSARRVATTARHGWLSPGATTSQPLIYVANDDEIDIYPQRQRNPPLAGVIIDGIDSASGLYVDANQDLYVANEGGNTVTVYPPRSLRPSMTYTQQLVAPSFVVTDNAGNVAVSSFQSARVVVFAPGQSKPQRILPTITAESDGLAFDSAGNLYVAIQGNGIADIEKFPPNSTKGRRLGMRLQDPQGLFIDGSGSFIVVEDGSNVQDVIAVFPPGSTKPSKTIDVDYAPFQLAVTAGPRQTAYLSNRWNSLVLSGPYPLRKFTTVKIKRSQRLRRARGLAVSNHMLLPR